MSPRKEAGGRRGGKPSGRSRNSGNGRSHARALSAEVVEGLPDADLAELHRFWGGVEVGALPESPADVRRQVLAWMRDAQRIDERVRTLGRRQSQVLGLHLEASAYQLAFSDLSEHPSLAYLSPYELEESLEVLQRRALLVECRDRHFKSYDGRAFCVPSDLAEGLLGLWRERTRGVFHSVTLRGHLERLYDDPGRLGGAPPGRLREMYKMYANESASVRRVERLPEDLRDLVDTAILQFGGLLPRGLFERMETRISRWNSRRWSKTLEESLVGTVDRLELSRYGIQHSDETLVIFNEVALAWLRHVAVPGDPDQPHSEAALGVDLVSNISRFMGFILEHNVRFTVRGEIFKTTEKRILQELIPNPGRELTRSEVLAFIYAYARHNSLIESTGERTFALTSQARDWESLDLDTKLRRLLDYAVEEKSMGGDPYHQSRMRRGFLRLLKRVEPGVWYDLMYLPFLSRNTYVASLDELEVDEYFAGRAQGGHYTPMEDLQRMAWNLAKWVRQRVYLLGLVDLGYDASDRPVALRLTRIGARLFGLENGSPAPAGALGSLIVTPDFEVVMFSNGDDAELVHELDRFCVREGTGQPMHFRISDRSVQRSLSEGLMIARILETLQTHSRTPLPSNVVYSIRDWAWRAGLMLLGSDGVLRCEEPDTLRRFCQDPAVRSHVREQLDEKRVQLKGRYSVRRMAALLRELDYLVELEG